MEETIQVYSVSLRTSHTSVHYVPQASLRHSLEKCTREFTMARNHTCVCLSLQTVSRFRHMRIHSEEKPFKCTVCPSNFSQSGHLMRHMGIHNGEKPYKCTICRSNFTQSGDLQRHMKIHSGKNPFKGSVCPSSFSVVI